MASKRSPSPANADREAIRRPTIHDVARRAGVTVGTASKALNGRGALREQTRERVRQAARELDFRPNELMLSLQRGRTYTVGFVAEDLEERFTMPLLAGIESAFGAARVLVYVARLDGDDTREQEVIDALLSRRIEGLVFSRTRVDVGPPVDVGSFPIPVVYVDTLVDDPEALCIIPDDAQGATLAARHLLAAGRRRFVHLAGPAHWLSTRLRLDAFRAALREAGLDLPDDHVGFADWSESWGYRGIADMVRADPAIDALFAGNDMIARGAMDRLIRMGYRIPEDVAIVGFDNMRTLVQGAHPPITSIDMNLSALGRSAAQHLLAMIEGESRSGVQRMPCSLVVRESSGGRAVD